ncbi:hypothetical protein ACJX0J_006314, partial [Zea mays]
MVYVNYKMNIEAVSSLTTNANIPCLLFSCTTVGIEFYVYVLFSVEVIIYVLYHELNQEEDFEYIFNKHMKGRLEIVGFSLFVFTRPRTVNFDHKTDILFHKAESLPSCQIITRVNNLCIIWTGLKFSWSKLTPPYKACEMIVYLSEKQPLLYLKIHKHWLIHILKIGVFVITISATQKCFFMIYALLVYSTWEKGEIPVLLLLLYALFHFGITYIPPAVEMNQWNKM